MWIPNIVEKERVFDKIKIVVEFTDGQTSFTDVYYIDSGNMDNLKSQVQNKLNRLQELDTVFPTIQKGQLDTTVTKVEIAPIIP